MQALCFFAGANTLFYGDKLLTTGNPEHSKDDQLFAALGIKPEVARVVKSDDTKQELNA
jgi:biotin synthase